MPDSVVRSLSGGAIAGHPTDSPVMSRAAKSA
jgi:hypothetical protein